MRAAISSSAGRPAQFGFERLPRLFQLGVLAAHQPRHPIHGAQLVEHGAANARHAIRLELDAAIQIEGVDGVHETEDAGADQVVQIHAIGQPRPDPFRIVLDQRQVQLDELIPQLHRRFVLVFKPQLLDIHVHMRHHGFLPDEGKPVKQWKVVSGQWPVAGDQRSVVSGQ